MPIWLTTLPQRALIGAVRFYRFFFSAWIGNVCRYSPSCSAYALQALQQHGAAAGAGLAAWRVLRCNPFCLGGHDPVPACRPRLFGDRFGNGSRDRFGADDATAAFAAASSTSNDKTSP